MKCETCNRECQVLWRIARWSDAGIARDVCPVCGLRLLGMDDSVAAYDERRFRITGEIREKKQASA
jgi:hypothetical protein